MSNRSGETKSNHLMRIIVHWEVGGVRQELHLREGDTVQIGRDSENDIVLEGALISRRHAVIAWAESGFELRDLGSRNGTFVNERLVSAPVLLQAGDVMDIANTRITYDDTGRQPSLDTLPNEITAVVERPPHRQRASQ